MTWKTNKLKGIKRENIIVVTGIDINTEEKAVIKLDILIFFKNIRY